METAGIPFLVGAMYRLRGSYRPALSLVVHSRCNGFLVRGLVRVPGHFVGEERFSWEASFSISILCSLIQGLGRFLRV